MDNFKEVWDEYYKPLVLFSMRFVIQKDVAEDIVQDSFLKLLKATDQSNPKSFLFKCCQNASIDFIRSKNLHAEIHELLPEPPEMTEYDMMYFEYVHQLSKVIHHLSPREQDVIKMILSGMSSADICKALGNTQQTVRNQKTNAIIKLQQLLQGNRRTVQF